MAGYFQIKKSDGGALSFTLKAGNHEVILVSRMHQTDTDLRLAIVQVRRNSQLAERFKRMVAKDKSPYFVLTGEEGQVLGTSEMYLSAAAMENGIRSVMSNGAAQLVKEAV
jgi:uncharacterized protein YegP (UPF0339 family)